MGLISRILASIKDGSFAFKLLNRLSTIQYVPGPEKEIDEFLTKHHPESNAWRTWSLTGRKTWLQFQPIFHQHKIQFIAYVGANEGQTVLALNTAFPGREFLLVEPVLETFGVLLENTKHFKNMHCLNVAAGAKEESRPMFVDEYSPASSLLSYDSIALQEYPFLGKQRNVNVTVKPLDMILKENRITGVDLLVMDVQGYEDEVLIGASETLKSCKVVISELSLQALYRGSSTFDSVYQTLIQKGFLLQYLINPMQGESRQILQIDGIFVRVRHE